MLFQKIKQRYNQNLIESFIKNSDIESLKRHIKTSFLDNKKMDMQHVMHYLKFFTSQEKFENLFSKNLIWINGFEKDDYQYLNKFLNELFLDQEISFKPAKEYHSCLFEIAEKYSLPKIDFDDFCNFNYLYQYIISEEDSKTINLINTSSVFFQTAELLYFTHYYLTKAFIYVARSPYSLLKKYKLSNADNSSVNHLQGLLSGENKRKFYLNEKIYVEENIESWSNNNSSWSNKNVVSTFRGIIIDYEKLANETFETLSYIISHLIQSGLSLNLDYNFIEKYISNNPFPYDDTSEITISNNEKKLLDRDNLKVIKQLFI